MGAQKNLLDEMLLLRTKTHVNTDVYENSQNLRSIYLHTWGMFLYETMDRARPPDRSG